MNRKARIFFEDRHCGFLEETDEGYKFYYLETYLAIPDSKAVSKTLPIRQEAYFSKTLFAFFDGLIPEGWLLNIAEEHWKVDRKDRMGLLLTCCRDTIGAVSVEPEIDKK